MRNTRDSFDILFENGRTGWVNRRSQRPALNNGLMRIHEQWKNRKDSDLEAFVLGLLADTSIENNELPEARTEGGEKVYVSARHERNPKLRKKALLLHGLECMACGFNFSEFYGKIGADFIEVHHVVPLSKSGRKMTDPLTDLIVLCANCHRMTHRQRGICLSLDELKRHIKRVR